MLTLADLNGTLLDDRHLGWGYMTAQNLGRGTRRLRLDTAVVKVANELHLDYEGLFLWSNSKYGRWLVDDVYGNSAPPTQKTVRKHLNAAMMQGLAEEEL